MSEIKPQMVDGEAVCDGRECCHCDSVVRARRDGGLCTPYYRACAKQLTGVIDRQTCEIERLRKDLDAAAKMCAKHATAYIRAEAAEAENEQLHATLDLKQRKLESCHTENEWLRAGAWCEMEELRDRAKRAEAERDRLAAIVLQARTAQVGDDGDLMLLGEMLDEHYSGNAAALADD